MDNKNQGKVKESAKNAKIDNDTIAIVGLIIIAITGLFFSQENTTAVAVGALGGVITAKAL